MQGRRMVFCLSAFAVLIIIITTTHAIAAEPANNSLEKIVDLYHDKTRAWQSTLRDLALNLFWLLAGIEMAWAAIRLAVKGADFSEWLSELLTQIMFIGFFLALLVNSADWAKAIISSFQTAADRAAQASGVQGGSKPSDIFDVGLDIALKVMDQTSFWHPGDSVGLMIACLIIVVCFALIAAFIILALVESYIVISAGVLLMGFGGSRWTKDIAVKTIVYAVSVGAKLFVLQLLVALAQQLFQQWSWDFATTNSDILVVVGSSIVMLALAKVVPDMVQGLINGSSVSSGSALLAAGAGFMAGATAVAAGAAGAGRAGAAAGRLASEQLADSELNGTSPSPPPPGRGARWVGAAARNLGVAAARHVGERLGGRATWGAAMASAMNEEAERRRRARAEREAARRPEDGRPEPVRRGPGNVIRGDDRT